MYPCTLTCIHATFDSPIKNMCLDGINYNVTHEIKSFGEK